MYVLTLHVVYVHTYRCTSLRDHGVSGGEKLPKNCGGQSGVSRLAVTTGLHGMPNYGTVLLAAC